MWWWRETGGNTVVWRRRGDAERDQCQRLSVSSSRLFAVCQISVQSHAVATRIQCDGLPPSVPSPSDESSRKQQHRGWCGGGASWRDSSITGSFKIIQIFIIFNVLKQVVLAEAEGSRQEASHCQRSDGESVETNKRTRQHDFYNISSSSFIISSFWGFIFPINKDL